MKRNLLLPPPPDSERCTGRTTAIALSAITKAITQQGAVNYCTDHSDPCSRHAGVRMRDKVNELVAKLGLEHISVTLIESNGQYHNHVRVQSCIWGD